MAECKSVNTEQEYGEDIFQAAVISQARKIDRKLSEKSAPGAVLKVFVAAVVTVVMLSSPIADSAAGILLSLFTGPALLTASLLGGRKSKARRLFLLRRMRVVKCDKSERLRMKAE